MFSFLFVDTERVWRGGQDQLLTLLNGLRRNGHRVHLLCHPAHLLEKRARELSIAVHPVAIRSEVGLISFFRLLAILRSVRPDVLAFNTPRAIHTGNAGIANCFDQRKNRFPPRQFSAAQQPLHAIQIHLGYRLHSRNLRIDTAAASGLRDPGLQNKNNL